NCGRLAARHRRLAGHPRPPAACRCVVGAHHLYSQGAGLMYLTSVKLVRLCFWAALAATFLSLFVPEVVPWWIPAGLGVSWAGLFVYCVLHVKLTRRSEYRCPECGWVPFALNAWKCKRCRFVWDSFRTAGACTSCGHQHDETACLKCRRISPNKKWLANDRS